jgi:hypothetical protein
MSSPERAFTVLLVHLRRLFGLIVEALESHIRHTDLNRAQLRHELKGLRQEVRQLGGASVESLGYVGRELRNLAGALEAGGHSRLGSHACQDLIEAPFVFRSLAGIQPPARVLTVGGSGSLCLSLASLGFDVTALDPRGVVLEHPRLEAIDQRLEDWDPAAGDFAAIILTGRDQAGYTAGLERLGDLLAPGGILVLTVPLGSDGAEDVGSLSALLSGWEVSEQTVIARHGESTWEPSTNGAATDAAIALVAARLPDS